MTSKKSPEKFSSRTAGKPFAGGKPSLGKPSSGKPVGRSSGKGKPSGAKAARGMPGGASQRMLRVAEQVRHAMAEILMRGEIHDPVLSKHVISISEVKLSPDLSLATAYVMPLGGGDAAAVVAALEKHKGLFRMRVASHVNLRHAPEIRFRHDETFDRALHMDRLLDSPRVKADLGKA